MGLELLSILEKAGVDEATATVQLDNVDAIRFYQQLEISLEPCLELSFYLKPIMKNIAERIRT
jgi:ribosomal protein S18 acetylase RimI-like enzyme